MRTGSIHLGMNFRRGVSPSRWLGRRMKPGVQREYAQWDRMALSYSDLVVVAALYGELLYRGLHSSLGSLQGGPFCQTRVLCTVEEGEGYRKFQICAMGRMKELTKVVAIHQEL
jgi:hypothetical protein